MSDVNICIITIIQIIGQSISLIDDMMVVFLQITEIPQSGPTLNADCC